MDTMSAPASASPNGLRLTPRRARRIWGSAVARIIAICFAATLGLWLCGWLALRWVPIPRGLLQPPAAQVEFTDRDGVPLRAIRVPDHSFDRPVTYSEI